MKASVCLVALMALCLSPKSSFALRGLPKESETQPKMADLNSKIGQLNTELKAGIDKLNELEKEFDEKNDAFTKAYFKVDSNKAYYEVKITKDEIKRKKYNEDQELMRLLRLMHLANTRNDDIKAEINELLKSLAEKIYHFSSLGHPLKLDSLSSDQAEIVEAWVEEMKQSRPTSRSSSKSGSKRRSRSSSSSSSSPVLAPQ